MKEMQSTSLRFQDKKMYLWTLFLLCQSIKEQLHIPVEGSTQESILPYFPQSSSVKGQ